MISQGLIALFGFQALDIDELFDGVQPGGVLECFFKKVGSFDNFGLLGCQRKRLNSFYLRSRMQRGIYRGISIGYGARIYIKIKHPTLVARYRWFQSWVTIEE